MTLFYFILWRLNKNINKTQQMENNYTVYQHVTPDEMYYFGQTNDIKHRWRGNGIGYKGTALEPYIEQYGWENIKHIILFENQTKENALFIENFLIETAREDGVCINQRRSGNVSKEEGYKRDYYEQNKDGILNKQKQYREQNKDKIKERNKQYREQNKDKYRDYKRQYRRRKKEEKQLKEHGNFPLF